MTNAPERCGAAALKGAFLKGTIVFGVIELLFSLWLNLASNDSLGSTVQNQDPTMTRSISLGWSADEGAVKLPTSALSAVMPRYRKEALMR